MMESVIIFFPLLEVHKDRRNRRATWAAISQWENKPIHGLESFQSISQAKSSMDDIGSPIKASMYSMQALEQELESNPRNLFEFAATKQFTGENIVFLTRIRAWKEQWAQAVSGKGTISSDTKRKLFESAKEIFERNISLHSSQFPINLESKTYHELEHIFGSHTVCSVMSIISPFSEICDVDGKKESRAGVEPVYHTDAEKQGSAFAERSNTSDGFDDHIFDAAERSVKQIVFLNTWPRYLETWSRKTFLST